MIFLINEVFCDIDSLAIPVEDCEGEEGGQGETAEGGEAVQPEPGKERGWATGERPAHQAAVGGDRQQRVGRVGGEGGAGGAGVGGSRSVPPCQAQPRLHTEMGRGVISLLRGGVAAAGQSIACW